MGAREGAAPGDPASHVSVGTCRGRPAAAVSSLDTPAAVGALGLVHSFLMRAAKRLFAFALSLGEYVYKKPVTSQTYNESWGRLGRLQARVRPIPTSFWLPAAVRPAASPRDSQSCPPQKCPTKKTDDEPKLKLEPRVFREPCQEHGCCTS